MELGETKSLAIAVVDIGAVERYVSEPLINPQHSGPSYCFSSLLLPNKYSPLQRSYDVSDFKMPIIAG